MMQNVRLVTDQTRRYNHTSMRIQVCVISFILLLVMGCSDVTPTATPHVIGVVKLPPAPTAVPQNTSTLPPPTNTPSATNTPEPTATNTPRPTETPIPVQLIVSNQKVRGDGLIVVDRAIVPERSWLSVYSADSYILTTVLDAGDNRNIELIVNPLSLGGDITFSLHEYSGSRFDVEDNTVFEIAGNPVQVTIESDVAVVVPSITAADQLIGEDGILTLGNITLDRAGWVAVYTDDAGAIGEQIGLRYMEAGSLDNVTVPIAWRKGSPQLTVMLHEDMGRSGRFDPAESDPPILVRNQPVATLLAITYPPMIDVLDQSIVNNVVYVERVVANEPAWLAIWNDNEFGQPNRVIGFAPLEAGINTNIGVEVAQGIVTDDLYAQIHVDLGDAGVFNFPGLDQPVTVDGDIRPVQFDARSGNYVIASDQTIQRDGDQAAVTVDLAVSDLDMFVVIRTDDEETPGIAGDVIGHKWVPAGINRTIVVEIADDALTPILYATLHIDQDALRTFEFPDGRDFELVRNGSWIAVPFGATP